MLVKGSTNFHQVFDRQIKRAERTTLRFSELLDAKNFNKWWPEVREKLRQMLLDNLDLIHDVQVSPRTTKMKKKMMEDPLSHQFVRKVGGPELPIVSTKPWEVTQSMKNTIGSGIKGDRARPQFRPMEIRISIGAETADFVPDVEYSVPYPEAVDLKLMERSGGSVGLVRLDDGQISQILEMFVKKNENLADRIFRGVHF